MSSARNEPQGSPPHADRLALAFEVLELVAERRNGISANELASRLCLHRATVYRAVNWLVQQEFLLRKPDFSGFILGVRVVELAKLISVAEGPVDRLVTELRRETGATLHLARFVDFRIEVVNEDPDRPLSNPSVFASEPARSAVGQLLLAELPIGQAARIAGVTEVEIGALVQAAEVRSFAQQIGLLSPDRACLAVPVRVHSGTLDGALALCTEPSRISTAARHVERLRAAASELAELWQRADADANAGTRREIHTEPR